MAAYLVQADIKYVDGALAGIVVPAGQNVTFPTLRSAKRHYDFLYRVYATHDFVRSCTGSGKYEVVMCPTLQRIK